MARGVKTGGRRRGTPNKFSRELKEMILEALDRAGGVEYLTKRATDTPGPFLALVGKVLPMSVKTQGSGLVFEFHAAYGSKRADDAGPVVTAKQADEPGQ
jgi:hypothetical protein